MSVTSRADDIRTRLTDYFLNEIGCPVSPLPRDDWDAVIDELGPYARYGIAWPMPFNDPQGPLIVPFQADVVADVTSQLDDEALSDYLDTVEHLLELQIIEQLGDRQEAAPMAALLAAEAELDEQFPGSVALLQQTHLAALDRWAGG